MTRRQKSIDGALARIADRFRWSYGGKVDRFWADCQLVDWTAALSAWKGEAVADDENLGADRTQITETVKGTQGGRRRANSLPAVLGGQQEAVQAAYDKASVEPRSFIRTWVRIVKTKKT
jgi:hypothetical protein